MDAPGGSPARPPLDPAYLVEDYAENSSDPLLASVDASRVVTLVAAPDRDGYLFDVRLQGADETVLLDVAAH